jgi:DHA3 family macrolide efflux protein-like MFS transporter
VIGIDAASFGVLALSYRLALPGSGTGGPASRIPSPTNGPRADPDGEAGPAAQLTGFAAIRHDRSLLALLALTFGFFLLFRPVYVALPVHVADDLHASASLLGAHYTPFGVGAVCGGLIALALRLRPTT